MEQQLANNNVNAGGSFVEAGLQQINVRAVGLFTNVDDIAQTVVKTQNGTPVRVRDIATVTQAPKIRLGQIGKAIHRADGTVVDTTTWSKESCCCARARTPTRRWWRSTTR